jgi:hypothetical protein
VDIIVAGQKKILPQSSGAAWSAGNGKFIVSNWVHSNWTPILEQHPANPQPAELAEEPVPARLRSAEVLPRVLRIRDAPAYLGMNRALFNQLVRPQVSEVVIGIQGVAFDRLELDAWWAQYKQSYGRPAPQPIVRRDLWDGRERQGSPNGVVSGTSAKRSKGMGGFERALAAANSKKRSAI